MCFLCLKDDPFRTANVSDLDRQRARALEIKRLVREAEDERLCDIGDVTFERLKEEQRRLSRIL